MITTLVLVLLLPQQCQPCRGQRWMLFVNNHQVATGSPATSHQVSRERKNPAIGVICDLRLARREYHDSECYRQPNTAPKPGADRKHAGLCCSAAAAVQTCIQCKVRTANHLHVLLHRRAVARPTVLPWRRRAGYAKWMRCERANEAWSSLLVKGGRTLHFQSRTHLFLLRTSVRRGCFVQQRSKQRSR